MEKYRINCAHSALQSASGLERVACVSKDGNLGSGHPLSPLARLPGPTGHPDRASHAAEHSVLGRLYPHAC